MLALLLLSAVLLAALIYQSIKMKEMEKMLKSERVRRGKELEHFIPLGIDGKFRFIGDPIDGIIFRDDEIVLVEIKTGRAGLSSGQRRIRELVEKGKVRFEVVRR